MIRLVDEIVTNSSYIDQSQVDMVEYVGISYAALDKITEEIGEELDTNKVNSSDIESALTLKYLVMPSLNGVDYKFFKELRLV